LISGLGPRERVAAARAQGAKSAARVLHFAPTTSVDTLLLEHGRGIHYFFNSATTGNVDLPDTASEHEETLFLRAAYEGVQFHSGALQYLHLVKTAPGGAPAPLQIFEAVDRFEHRTHTAEDTVAFYPPPAPLGDGTEYRLAYDLLTLYKLLPRREYPPNMRSTDIPSAKIEHFIDDVAGLAATDQLEQLGTYLDNGTQAGTLRRADRQRLDERIEELLELAELAGPAGTPSTLVSHRPASDATESEPESRQGSTTGDEIMADAPRPRAYAARRPPGLGADPATPPARTENAIPLEWPEIRPRRQRNRDRLRRPAARNRSTAPS
jgi:hypothetical protein